MSNPNKNPIWIVATSQAPALSHDNRDSWNECPEHGYFTELMPAIRYAKNLSQASAKPPFYAPFFVSPSDYQATRGSAIRYFDLIMQPAGALETDADIELTAQRYLEDCADKLATHRKRDPDAPVGAPANA